MKSPFPGMDPYLEVHWGDWHTSFVVYGRDQLQPQLPAGLFARAEERLQESESRSTDLELATQRAISITDTKNGNRLVTMIEFLSPFNKIEREGRPAYQRRQADLLNKDVNLVEIDLVREGKYTLAIPVNRVEREGLPSCYRVCISRGFGIHRGEYYRVSLRDRLPVIRIPLRLYDRDVSLDLQALFDTAYRNGRYDSTNYRVDPQPPLQGDDAVWADALLREKELR